VKKLGLDPSLIRQSEQPPGPTELSPNNKEGYLMSQHTYVGIDVSKKSFDVAVDGESEHQKYQMNKTDLKKSIKYFKKQKPKLIVLESTGGYERTLVVELVQAKLPVSIINPRMIRDFAKSTGQLAKTDKIDAFIIAQYAATIKPKLSKVLDENTQELKEFIRRRKQLIYLRSITKNHKEHATHPTVIDSVDLTIQNLTQQINDIEQSINNHIHSDPDFKQKHDRLMSVPGIGSATASTILTDLPEIGTFNRCEIAAIVGVAPINRDSGQFRGKRMTGGGRRHLRKALYMPVVAIIRCNQKLKSFYQKLVNSGKPKMLALIATMRKLLIIMNSMIKNKTNWNSQPILT